MTLEQKVDLIMRWIVTNDDKEYAELSSQIRKAVTSGECDPVPDIAVAPSDIPRVRFIIEDILKELGVPTNIKGHRYLVESIYRVYHNPEYLESLTKGLYVDVAYACNTTASRVERAMRHAISQAFERGSLDSILKIFGYSVSAKKTKATIGEFISAVANELKRRV